MTGTSADRSGADPDHRQGPARSLMAAEAICRRRGLRFTRHRREVFRVIADQREAIGAYEILARLSTPERQPAPIIVYRALDFLISCGLVHRLASRNAYVACAAPETEHSAQFLICRRCNRIVERSSAAIGCAVDAEAAALDFTVDQPVIELAGLCRSCRAASEGGAGGH